MINFHPSCRTSFCIATFLSTVGMVTERVSGSWHRLLAAGVKPYFFLFPHLIECSSILLIQFIEFSIYTNFFLLTTRTLSSVSIATGFIFMSSLTGLVFGLLFSIVMSTPMQALMFTQFIVYPVTFISGEIFEIFFCEFSIKFSSFIIQASRGHHSPCQQCCSMSPTFSPSPSQSTHSGIFYPKTRTSVIPRSELHFSFKLAGLRVHWL